MEIACVEWTVVKTVVKSCLRTDELMGSREYINGADVLRSGANVVAKG